MKTSNLIDALHKVGLFGMLDRGRDYAVFAKAAKRPSFSQYGEDLFLREHFGNRQGVYIDIGGNHPLSLSNTYLLYRMGWSGLVVEPIRRLCAKHRRFRPRDIQVNAAVGDTSGRLTFYEMIPSCLSTCDLSEVKHAISARSARLMCEYSVPVVTLAELYRTHLSSRTVSLLSIDTEGHDMAVLHGNDWNTLRPEIVICEANDDSQRAEIEKFLASYEYDCVKSLGCNVLFARR